MLCRFQMFGQTDWPVFPAVAKSRVAFDNETPLATDRAEYRSVCGVCVSYGGLVSAVIYESTNIIYKFIFRWWYSVGTCMDAQRKNEFAFFMNEPTDGRASSNRTQSLYVQPHEKSWNLNTNSSAKKNRENLCMHKNGHCGHWPGRFDSIIKYCTRRINNKRRWNQMLLFDFHTHMWWPFKKIFLYLFRSDSDFSVVKPARVLFCIFKCAFRMRPHVLYIPCNRCDAYGIPHTLPISMIYVLDESTLN